MKAQYLFVKLLLILEVVSGQSPILVWGLRDFGNDGRGVVLSSVRSVFTCSNALGVLKEDGLFESYGFSVDGGNFSLGDDVEVDSMVCTDAGRAVLLTNGTVVTFGTGKSNDSSTVDFGDGVKQIAATLGTFAALKLDGSIVSWGLSSFVPEIEESVRFTQVTCNDGACAALKENGAIMVWGDVIYGSDWSTADLPSGIETVLDGIIGFAAVKSNGDVSAWQNAIGLNVSEVNTVFNDGNGFAFLFNNRSALSWSYQDEHYFQGPIRTIVSALKATSVVLEDDSVVVWGSGDAANSSHVDFSGGIAQVVGNIEAFAVLKNDSTVQCWGNPSYGGVGCDPNLLVEDLFAGELSFTALKNDGTIYTWGNGLSSPEIDYSRYSIESIRVGRGARAADKGSYYIATLISSPRPSIMPTLSPIFAELPSEDGTFVSVLGYGGLAFICLLATLALWKHRSAGSKTNSHDAQAGVNSVNPR
mmetsp:Transcript_18061/g.31961  ORF Transcript_18061/g.31961 Transcript_18061/m.31961 type:complete len:474 (-) Transcript_18061:355-1776(-)